MILTLDRIKETVCLKYGLNTLQFLDISRTHELARPRQIAIYLGKTLLGHSWCELGRAFCRDHTTALHAFRRVEQLRRQKPWIEQDLQELTAILSTGREYPVPRKLVSISERDMRRAWKKSAVLTRVSGSAH